MTGGRHLTKSSLNVGQDMGHIALCLPRHAQAQHAEFARLDYSGFINALHEAWEPTTKPRQAMAFLVTGAPSFSTHQIQALLWFFTPGTASHT